MTDGDVSCIAPAAKCMFIDHLQTSHARIVLETATKPTRFARIGQGANPLHPPDTKCPLNVRKWSENVMFLAFWLRSVFRAPTTCTFEHYFQKCWCVLNILTTKRVHLWTSQLTVLRTWCVLHLLTSKCAWGRTACTFSTSQLPKMLRTRHFLHFELPNVLCATTVCTFSSLIWSHGFAPAALASLLFYPPEPQNTHQCFATFLNLFARPDLFSSFLFSLPTFPFASVHFFESLTSKFPSTSSIYNKTGFQSYLLALALKTTDTSMAWARGLAYHPFFSGIRENWGHHCQHCHTAKERTRIAVLTPSLPTPDVVSCTQQRHNRHVI